MSLSRKHLLIAITLTVITLFSVVWVAIAATLSPDSALSAADTIFQGEAALDRAGTSVAALGDVNGDGLPDFAIGAPLNSQAAYSAGKVYIYFGREAGWDPLVNLGLSNASYLGELEMAWAGGAVSAAGDVNNDGYDDILIGAPHDNENGIEAGQVYLIFGKPSDQWGMNISLAQADASFWGEAEGDNAGASVAGVGDVNDDGYDDILIGAPKNNPTGDLPSAGQVYLILGRETSSWMTDTLLSTADAFYHGENQQAQAGYSVAGAGDVDKDGKDDILVGAWLEKNSFPNAGEAYLILSRDLVYNTLTSLFDSSASFMGEHLGYWAGISVSAAGDVNRDGYADFLIGATGNDDRGRQTGEAYLVLGKTTGWTKRTPLADVDASYRAEWEDSWAGQTVAPAGDMNQDGYDDFLIAALRADEGGTDAGMVYLVLGHPNSVGWSQDTELTEPYAAASFIGENAQDYAGTSLASLGDVNGDGWNDLMIGAPQNDGNGDDSGRAYLLLGNDYPSAGHFAADKPFDNINHFYTFSASYYDLANGYEDIASARLYINANGDQIIARYYLQNGREKISLQENGALIGNCRLGDPETILGALFELDCATTTAVNDGASGLTIGWQLKILTPVTQAYALDFELQAQDKADHSSGQIEGGSWIIDPATHDFYLSTATDTFNGETAKDIAGWAVAYAGDVNADGLGDFLIGAPNYSTYTYNGGNVYLFLGKAGGWGADFSLADADATFIAESDYDYAGYALAGVGDVNNDGRRLSHRRI